MVLINVEVEKVVQEAKGIRSFVLAKKGLFKLPGYSPGAHIDVHCGAGIVRQYSLCGDPSDRRRLMIAVRQVDPSRGGSDLMHNTVAQGDRLEIGAPRNNFPLDETAAHSVLLAAGIGITPIIAMADRLHRLGRSFALHYFSRATGHTAFRTRLEQSGYAENVTFHEGLDVPSTGQMLDDILAQPVVGGQVYICGPAPFMDRAEAAAQEHWASDAINLERFAAKPALAGPPAKPFTVELARRGITLEVRAEETILDVLEANEIDAAFSCEQGVCGTCVTDVLSGTPELSVTQATQQRKDDVSLCFTRY